MVDPHFLDLPARSNKPRGVGITHVIDNGLPTSVAAAVLETSGAYIDVWKFGWGTAYVDPGLARKLKLLSDHAVLACPGGTLLEAAWAQGREEAFFAWAGANGFPCVEVSAGCVQMSRAEKDRLIAAAADRFTVLAEAGQKEPKVSLTPNEWAETVTHDLTAGATWVLTEGRESGTVGVYTAAGTVREDVVEAVVAAAGIDRVVFEAPRKDQQAWLINRFGSDVNLANVRPAEALGLETLRLGLRADTFRIHTSSGRVALSRVGDEAGES